MLKIAQARHLSLLAACTLALAGCGKSADDGERGTPLTDTSGLLRYVPADSPYVFGAVAPPPDAFMDKIEPKLDRLLGAYARMLDAGFTEAQEMDALVEELGSLLTLEGLRGAGITRESTFIVYGNGLLPVIRMTLSEAALFEDAIARIEAKAGEQLAVGSVGDTPYRYVEQDGVRAILATVGDELVMTFAPDVLDDTALARLLGLTLPAQNIAETGKLRDIADAYGFMHEYPGLVDTVRLAETFIDEPGGIDALLFEMAGYDAGSLSDVCKAELRSLAKVAPRVVSGYEEVSAERIRGTTVVEIRDDIAAEMATFTSPVPGLGTTYGGLVSFGMSLNVKAVRNFLDKRVAALQENPWECEHLADLQNGLFGLRERALAQPVPPVLYDFRGFMAVIEELDGFDFGKKQPPETIDASFVLAIDNAQGLLAMGQAMIPQLAELAIEPDGKAHRVDVPDQGSGVEGAWIALADSAIAISVSDDAATALPALLSAESAMPPPFASMGLDGKRYYSLLGEAMRSSDDEEMSEEMRDAVSDIFEVAAELYERLEMDVSFTDRGIAMELDVSLAD